MVNATLAYQKNSLEVGDRANLILMMYEGALRFMSEAEKADGVDFIRLIEKAMNVVRALISSLDFERGGDIAKNLFRLYDFVLWKLDNAITSKDKTHINDAYIIMDELYKAWLTAIRNTREAK